MEIIARLREEREALVARIERIDEMLRQYEEWGREAAQLITVTGSITDQPEASRTTVEPATLTVAQTRPVDATSAIASSIGLRMPWPLLTSKPKTPIAQFEKTVIDVLRKATRPIDRTEIYEELLKRGVIIGSGGRDRDLNALSARVYRMAQDPKNLIKSERGQGYWIDADKSAESEDTVERNDGGANDGVFS